MVAYLHTATGDVVATLSAHDGGGLAPQVWPLNHCLPGWPRGAIFLARCKLGVMTYVVIKPLSAICTVVTYVYGHYGSGFLSLGSACAIRVWVVVCVLVPGKG